MRGLGAALSILAVLGFPGAATASHASQPSSFVPGELLVRFASSATSAVRADALSDLDATIVERLPLRGLVRVRLEPGTSVPAATAAFERRAGVRYAQPNHRRRIDATPNDTLFPNLWALHQLSDADIDAPEAWDVTRGSNAVTVAVVDTGVRYTHPDLDANMWVNDDPADGIHGWDFANNDSNPDDDQGHGTHVAGTIGAEGNNATGVVGVNWNVKLMAVKAAEDGVFMDSSIVNGFSYACRNGARVINGSFGGDDFAQAELDAINACPGALFVFAAGNSATNNDLIPHYPCNYNAANIVCVAASNASDQRASFSNYGVNSVDLAAPGDSILSTVPASSYQYLGGTSMATPHVAGAAALVLSRNPQASVARMKEVLMSSVDAKPGLGGIVATGGRLNVWRAVAADVIPPVGLSLQSTGQPTNTWTNNPSVGVSWGGATDVSGIDGFSFGWSPDATFMPDEVKDVEENVTSSSAVLPDGRTWFHVRARDGAGNWSEPVRLGPFQVDTFPPVRPVLSSPSHRVGVASTDRTIELNWTGASDSISGLDGFSLAWGRQRLVSVDQTKDVEEGAVRATSATLAAGAWWFGIRARDNAGNWTDATVLGPLVVTAVTRVCTVPRLRGLTLIGAKRSLVKKGCGLGRVSKAYSRRVRRGRVVGQRPAPGLRLKRGAKVAVVLSRGRRKR
jgi:subtilisin family serine protease